MEFHGMHYLFHGIPKLHPYLFILRFSNAILGVRNRFLKILKDLKDSVKVSIGVPLGITKDVPSEFCGIC